MSDRSPRRARRFRVVAALLFLSPASRLAAGDDERVAWLRAHAIPISTIDPASRDLSDLEPLRGLLAKKRIVMLGEATRGDGSSFLARTISFKELLGIWPRHVDALFFLHRVEPALAASD